MRKIPTLFVRNDADRGRITPAVAPGCEWVLAGEGVATRKFDGTCCLVRAGKLFKRQEIVLGTVAPPDWEPALYRDAASGHLKPCVENGKQQGWVPVGDGPEDKWHQEAWTLLGHELYGSGDALDGTYELVGPKVQGNAEGYGHHSLVKHGSEELYDCPRDFDGLKAYLAARDIEGVVWHHFDGRMAKIKAKDFGLKRKAAAQ